MGGGKEERTPQQALTQTATRGHGDPAAAGDGPVREGNHGCQPAWSWPSTEHSAWHWVTFSLPQPAVPSSHTFCFPIWAWICPLLTASLMAQWVKNPSAVQETQETRVQSLGQEGCLEEEMATHFSILSWRIPCTKEPGGLQPKGSQRFRRDRATKHARPLFPDPWPPQEEGGALMSQPQGLHLFLPTSGFT